MQADVSRPEEVAVLFEQTISKYSQVDVVVHCAGIMPLSPIAKGDVDSFDKVIATNLRSTFLIFSEDQPRSTRLQAICAMVFGC